MTAGIHLHMPEQEYHAHPALSSTGARRLLESPAKFRHAQTHPEKPKAAFDLGTAVHTKVLGTGDAAIAYPPEHLTPSGNVSTKAATVEWAAEQRAAGLTPISPDQMGEVDGMAEAVLAHPMARVLLEQDGSPEASVFATDPDTGVNMRARFDFLPTGERTSIAVDLKSARDASPAGFAKAAASHGYSTQRAWYLDTYEFAEPSIELDGFVFVVVETEAPFLVGVYRLNTEFEAIGAHQARRARRIYRECLDSGEWPGYSSGIESLMAPFWLVSEYAEVAA